MKTFPEVRIEIKPSKMLEGEVGVFAARNIKKDSIVVDASELKCKHFSWDIFEKLDTVTKQKVYGYCPGDKKGFCAPPDLNYISIAWHLNHSCDPNIGLDKNFNFVAMRNIKRGEELCWDYAYDETNPRFRMECSCGSKKCRKIVTGEDWKLLIKNKRVVKYLSENVKKHTIANGHKID